MYSIFVVHTAMIAGACLMMTACGMGDDDDDNDDNSFNAGVDAGSSGAMDGGYDWQEEEPPWGAAGEWGHLYGRDREGGGAPGRRDAVGLTHLALLES